MEEILQAGELHMFFFSHPGLILLLQGQVRLDDRSSGFSRPSSWHHPASWKARLDHPGIILGGGPRFWEKVVNRTIFPIDGSEVGPIILLIG